MADKYQWNYMSIPLNGANGKSITTSIAGPYNITLYNKFGCTSSSDMSLIQTVSLPSKPSITWNGIQFSTASTGVNYQWLLNNGAVSGATAATYKPASTGSYKVQITDNNGCKNLSDSFTLVVTAININNNTPASNIAKLYPNPATTTLIVQFQQTPTEDIVIKLLNNNGQIIKQVQTHNQSTSINVSNLSSGSYVLKILGKGYEQTQQVIIAR